MGYIGCSAGAGGNDAPKKITLTGNGKYSVLRYAVSSVYKLLYYGEYSMKFVNDAGESDTYINDTSVNSITYDNTKLGLTKATLNVTNTTSGYSVVYGEGSTSSSTTSFTKYALRCYVRLTGYYYEDGVEKTEVTKKQASGSITIDLSKYHKFKVDLYGTAEKTTSGSPSPNTASSSVSFTMELE